MCKSCCLRVRQLDRQAKLFIEYRGWASFLLSMTDKQVCSQEAGSRNHSLGYMKNVRQIIYLGYVLCTVPAIVSSRK